MQIKRTFNYEWYYKPSFLNSDITDGVNAADFEKVDLPHTNKVLPYNYLNEEDYQFVSCYKKSFDIPEEWKGKDIFLDFEGVMLAAEVYVNGTKICSHEGGYTPFSADMTKNLNYGKTNCVTVKVDSTERKDIPPFGNVVDYLTYGGIYREVTLRAADKTRLEHVFLTAKCAVGEAALLEAEAVIQTAAGTLTGEEASLLLELKENGKVIDRKEQPITLIPGISRYKVQLSDLADLKRWDIEEPYLYDVSVTLITKDDRDIFEEKYGFRDSVFKTDGYYLNGKKVKLVGLNRHQSYPYVGYAMPKRIQEADAQLLKRHTGTNVVRCSHYPQSVHFLKECDRLGLLVIEEIPGWQHIGNEDWKKHSMQDVEDMIVRDFNHPSVILWGVRINESQDDHDFYAATNELSRKLDSSRQTGGTRYIQRSEFLEDVYTYNDFTHNGGEIVFRPQKESTGLDKFVPTLVTESNGHMYPTKRFDHESRLAEHAVRHLKVINESRGREDLVGGISWCAFDYNTHGCFGSGDKICYHGVYDMFRNPKYAAFSYSSQKDPKDGIVLEAASLVSRGEKDGGGIVPFMVMTNCDYIKVFKNGKEVGDFYPDKEKYPNLEHPPVVVSHVLEADADFGFSKEDMTAFKDFLIKNITSGQLMSPSNEDLAYLMGLAAKYEMGMPQLFGAVIKMAGGWGDTANNISLVGYLDGKEVCGKEIGENKSAASLRLTADDTELLCGKDTYDATRITVEAVDTLGNLMPFTQDCVKVTLDGSGILMGPDKFALIGGISSFWVRTTGEEGKLKVCVEGMYHSAECEIQVVKE